MNMTYKPKIKENQVCSFKDQYCKEPVWISRLRNRLPEMPFVSILGSSIIDVHDPLIYEWHSLGELLAQYGVGILYGGNQDVMAFFSQKAISNGGYSICIDSDKQKDIQRNYSDTFIVDSPIQKMEALARLANLYIILPGGIGTLAETITSLLFIDRGFMGHKKFVFLGEHWDNLIELLKANPFTFRELSIDQIVVKIPSPEKMPPILSCLFNRERL